MSNSSQEIGITISNPVGKAGSSGTIIRYDQLVSTNDEATRLGKLGAASGTLILADQQTGGRGRQGRQWLSPLGNFYGTWIVRSGRSLTELSQISLVAAIALFDAVAVEISETRVASLSLKWPNDLLFNGAKLAGILVESELKSLPPLQSPQLDFVKIGIGVNLLHAPQVTGRKTVAVATLVDAAVTPNRDAFAASLHRQLMQRLHQWEADGFARLSEIWNGYAQRQFGLAMKLHNSIDERGYFMGIDKGGSLLLKREDGEIRTINSGEWNFVDLPD